MYCQWLNGSVGQRVRTASTTFSLRPAIPLVTIMLFSFWRIVFHGGRGVVRTAAHPPDPCPDDKCHHAIRLIRVLSSQEAIREGGDWDLGARRALRRGDGAQPIHTGISGQRKLCQHITEVGSTTPWLSARTENLAQAKVMRGNTRLQHDKHEPSLGFPEEIV